MLEFLNFSEVELWLLGTAIIFTFVGGWMAQDKSHNNTARIIEATIDRLIREGYVKAQVKENGDIELLKHDDAG